MKKNAIKLWAVLVLVPFIGNAQDVNKDDKKEENKKLELKPYGFVKGDMVFATSGVFSWLSPANCYLSAPQLASGKDTAALGFTAQHTRFGLKGSVGEKIKAGGTVELDFYGGAFDGNIRPRIRLAYASLINGDFEIRMGQQWDIFSPNNANTNNTNGNLWYAGNRGFRRAQLQLIYTKANKTFAPTIQLSAGEASKEDYIASTGLGKDNLSGMPLIQARISGKIKEKYVVGVSYVTAGYLERKGTVETGTAIKDTLKSELKYNTSGIGVDVTLPFHKYFSLTGEFNTGTNLNDANLFNIAGNHSWSINDSTKEVKRVDKKSMGMWFNATSKITDWFNIVIGYGMDVNTTSDLAKGAYEGNTVIYGDLVFPLKHGFSLALEAMNIATKIKEGKTNSAMVFNLSGKINF